MALWRRMHELRGTDLSPDEIDAAITKEFPDDLAWREERRPADLHERPRLRCWNTAARGRQNPRVGPADGRILKDCNPRIPTHVCD